MKRVYAAGVLMIVAVGCLIAEAVFEPAASSVLMNRGCSPSSAGSHTYSRARARFFTFQVVIWKWDSSN